MWRDLVRTVAYTGMVYRTLERRRVCVWSVVAGWGGGAGARLPERGAEAGDRGEKHVVSAIGARWPFVASLQEGHDPLDLKSSRVR